MSAGLWISSRVRLGAPREGSAGRRGRLCGDEPGRRKKQAMPLREREEIQALLLGQRANGRLLSVGRRRARPVARGGADADRSDARRGDGASHPQCLHPATWPRPGLRCGGRHARGSGRVGTAGLHLPPHASAGRLRGTGDRRRNPDCRRARDRASGQEPRAPHGRPGEGAPLGREADPKGPISPGRYSWTVCCAS